MKIHEPWLEHPGARSVMSVLSEKGGQAYYVGGCVRNALMGLPAADIDIATDARPEEVAALAEARGIRTIPTGIDHGTLTLVSHGESYEVTTFRNDVSTDGRRATVAFSDNILDDARRRDFTMNAIYAESDGTIVDPLGGLQDALDRRVKFIGNADDRIREDYLRILRFFRFNAIYGKENEMDVQGMMACRSGRLGLKDVSAERIGAETMKTLGAPDPSMAMMQMQYFLVLETILPGKGNGILDVNDAMPLPALIRMEKIAGLAPDPVRRLAAIHPEGDEVKDLFRLGRQEMRDLKILQSGMKGSEMAGELGYRYGDAAVDILALRAASRGSVLSPEAVREARHGAMQSMPVVAADLMPALQGKALGSRLKEIEAEWIASDFSLAREDFIDRPDDGPNI